MSIDETNIPVYIYLPSVNVDAVDNQIMSEDHDENGDAIGINDNIDDEVSYYDAQNVNETQKENVNDADSETIKGNDNDNNETIQ